jgi:enediyne biosynthesis protein E3
MPSLLKRWLQIRAEEVTCERRGFRVPRPRVREHLECIGGSFLKGYQAALDSESLADLPPRLEAVELEFRGFAYEGAAMALDLLDQLRPLASPLFPAFLAGPGQQHIYMLHVGAGWSMARLRLRLRQRLARLDPLLGWLALDGFGFHEGYFHWPQYANGAFRPPAFQGYALRAFDQGMGRSLWFVSGADPKWISAVISAFPEERRGDLWSGVGLACTYAGGCEEEEVVQLRELAAGYETHLAQGAVFGATTREHAGNAMLHTESACWILCGLSVQQAAVIANRTLREATEADGPAYEDWRYRIRSHFCGLKETGAEDRQLGLHTVAGMTTRTS